MISTENVKIHRFIVPKNCHNF